MSNNSEKNETPKPEKKKKTPGSCPRKIKVDPKLSIVQDVILLMNEAEIHELHYEQAGVKIHLRKGQGPAFENGGVSLSAPAANAGLGSASPAAAAPAQGPAAKADNAVTLNSPMVGTFYRSPSPEDKTFVEEGDKIAVGQIYCIIEAMKLMNEVKSEVAGKVVKILIQNGQAVEFNQPLIIVDPS
jgi:acetyl-CoA carboxylase biotin carboxyl carrier protein